MLEFEDGVSKTLLSWSASILCFMFNPLPSKFVDNGFENLQIFANYVLDRTTDYGRTLGEFVLRVLPQYPKCLAAANCRFQPLTHCNANAKQGKKVNKQGNAFFKHNNSSVCHRMSLLVPFSTLFDVAVGPQKSFSLNDSLLERSGKSGWNLNSYYDQFHWSVSLVSFIDHFH